MEIKFTEKKRNSPHWSGWYNAEIDYIDTYFTIDDKTRFLRGIAECAPDYEKRKIDTLKQQLIDNNAKFVSFYCHAPIDNCHPLNFLAWIRENQLTFEPFSAFVYISSLKVWEFRGNLREYSSAFQYRIWNKGLAIKVKQLYNKIKEAE